MLSLTTPSPSAASASAVLSVAVLAVAALLWPCALAVPEMLPCVVLLFAHRTPWVQSQRSRRAAQLWIAIHVSFVCLDQTVGIGRVGCVLLSHCSGRQGELIAQAVALAVAFTLLAFAHAPHKTGAASLLHNDGASLQPHTVPVLPTSDSIARGNSTATRMTATSLPAQTPRVRRSLVYPQLERVASAATLIMVAAVLPCAASIPLLGIGVYGLLQPRGRTARWLGLGRASVALFLALQFVAAMLHPTEWTGVRAVLLPFPEISTHLIVLVAGLVLTVCCKMAIAADASPNALERHEPKARPKSSARSRCVAAHACAIVCKTLLSRSVETGELLLLCTAAVGLQACSTTGAVSVALVVVCSFSGRVRRSWLPFAMVSMSTFVLQFASLLLAAYLGGADGGSCDQSDLGRTVDPSTNVSTAVVWRRSSLLCDALRLRLIQRDDDGPSWYRARSLLLPAFAFVLSLVRRSASRFGSAGTIPEYLADAPLEAASGPAHTGEGCDEQLPADSNSNTCDAYACNEHGAGADGAVRPTELAARIHVHVRRELPALVVSCAVLFMLLAAATTPNVWGLLYVLAAQALRSPRASTRLVAVVWQCARVLFATAVMLQYVGTLALGLLSSVDSSANACAVSVEGADGLMCWIGLHGGSTWRLGLDVAALHLCASALKGVAAAGTAAHRRSGAAQIDATQDVSSFQMWRLRLSHWLVLVLCFVLSCHSLHTTPGLLDVVTAIFCLRNLVLERHLIARAGRSWCWFHWYSWCALLAVIAFQAPFPLASCGCRELADAALNELVGVQWCSLLLASLGLRKTPTAVIWSAAAVWYLVDHQRRVFEDPRFQQCVGAWYGERARAGRRVADQAVERAVKVRSLHARRLMAWRQLQRQRLERIVCRLSEIEITRSLDEQICREHQAERPLSDTARPVSASGGVDCPPATASQVSPDAEDAEGDGGSDAESLLLQRQREPDATLAQDVFRAAGELADLTAFEFGECEAAVRYASGALGGNSQVAMFLTGPGMPLSSDRISGQIMLQALTLLFEVQLGLTPREWLAQFSRSHQSAGTPVCKHNVGLTENGKEREAQSDMEAAMTDDGTPQEPTSDASDVAAAAQQTVSSSMPVVEATMPNRAQRVSEENEEGDARSMPTPQARPCLTRSLEAARTMFSRGVSLCTLALRAWLQAARDPSIFDHAPATVSLAELARQVLLSRSREAVWLAMIGNHMINGNILSVVFPVSLFLFAALTSRPNRNYYDALAGYTLLLISLKCLVQLPLVCSSPPLSFRTQARLDGQALARCESDLALAPTEEIESALPRRVDHVLGLPKLSGYTSLPRDVGMLAALLPDLLLFLLLLVHREMLLARGIGLAHGSETGRPRNTARVATPAIDTRAVQLTTTAFGAAPSPSQPGTSANACSAAPSVSSTLAPHVDSPEVGPAINFTSQGPTPAQRDARCCEGVTTPLPKRARAACALTLSLVVLTAAFTASVTACLAVAIICSCMAALSNTAKRTRTLVRDVWQFHEQLLPSQGRAKGSDTDLYLSSFVVGLALWVYVLVFFASLVGGASSAEQTFGSAQFGTETVVALFVCIGVMVSDRVIYRLWTPPFAIDTSNDSGLPESLHEVIAPPGSAGSGYAVRWPSLAPLLKWCMHVALTSLIHAIVFFQLPLWNCAGEGCSASASGADDGGSNRIRCCHISAGLRPFYALACVYLYLSAGQLRHGLPLVPREHPLTESGVYAKLVVFKAFLQVPFLFEIRAILDWTVANTSLELFSYVKLEDIHAGLCVARADMLYRKGYRRGEPIPRSDKCLFGFFALFVLLLIVAGPLLLFSSASPYSEPNPIISAIATVSLVVTPRHADAASASRHVYSLASFSRFDLRRLPRNDPLLTTEFRVHQCRGVSYQSDGLARCGYKYLVGNSADEFQLLKFEAAADLYWQATLEAREELTAALVDESVNVRAELRVQWKRSLEIGSSGEASLSRSLLLSHDQRVTLVPAVREGGRRDGAEPHEVAIRVEQVFPKFVRLPSTTDVGAIALTGDAYRWHALQSLQLSQKSRPAGSELDQQWWKLHQASRDASPFNTTVEDGLQLVVESERVAGGRAAVALTSGGVLAFYALVVYAIGRVVKTVLRDNRYRIIIDEMPDTRDLVDLMEGVYIARHERQLMHETELHETILRLYRSPSLLLQLTGVRLRR